MVFDDCYDHEVWNKTDGERVLLLFDLWHPELAEEVKEHVESSKKKIPPFCGTRDHSIIRTQIANMTFDEIVDLTQLMCFIFYFLNMRAGSRKTPQFCRPRIPHSIATRYSLMWYRTDRQKNGKRVTCQKKKKK